MKTVPNRIIAILLGAGLAPLAPAHDLGGLGDGHTHLVQAPKRKAGGGGGKGPRIKKPRIEDTVKANIYADNWFVMYINGRLAVVDSIPFIPHNVISVDLLPEYPMTIAVMARDNGHPETGMEYNNTNTGDGGFILKFADGTVTSAKWKAKNFFHGPVGGDESNPKVKVEKLPEDWFAVDFDDSSWRVAKEYTEAEINPKKPYFEHDFEGAKWIWSESLKLDNTVIFRYRVEAPPNGAAVVDDWPRGHIVPSATEADSVENASTKAKAGGKTTAAPPRQARTAAPIPVSTGSRIDPTAPLQAKAFAPFVEELEIKWDDDFVYIGADAFPDHQMMKGITAWNQQVPLPQGYRGDNAWRIPRKPEPAERPVSAKTSLFKGAIAVAINGVPIFNPIKQDGRTDTNLAGELDEYGGHAGRADDYHYHLPPTFLNKVVGNAKPIGFGMDGYALYGFNEGDGTPAKDLDAFNGHSHGELGYHYHSTKAYPYLNGGLHGKVELRDGQVAVQPRAQGVRPYTRPLRGAAITDFKRAGEDSLLLTYTLGGETHKIGYKLLDGGAVSFEFIAPDGSARAETFQRRARGQRPPRGEGRGDRRKPPRRGERGDEGPEGRAGPAGKPNVVLFLADDMGWNDMGFSGSKVIETPHTDRLAREGVNFTAAYSSAPNCAPTRACLLSGQYPSRHGVYTVVDDRHAPGSPHHKMLAATSKASMATEVVTIAEQLKAGGYATAMYGMWNLGRGKDGPATPTGQGFEVFERPQSLGFEKARYFNDDGAYLTDRFTEEAIGFMEQKREEPFFVYLAYHGVHSPFEPKPDLLAKYEQKGAPDPAYAATVEAVDQNVGRIMAALERLGLDDNTLVVFTSDNGGNRKHTAPLRSGKGSVYEGGIRVPAAVWGPGVGVGKGLTNAEPILSMDFYPTVLDVAGLVPDPAHNLDGVSFAGALRGGSSPAREAVYWHFPCYIGGGGPASAVRKGDFKLIEFFEERRVELYNLKSDPGESEDLARSLPAKAKELYADLQAWQRATGASLVTEKNPNFDPNAAPKRGRDQRGKGRKRKKQ